MGDKSKESESYGQITHKMIEFNIKSYIVLRLISEHNFVLVEIYNHQTGTNTTFFHNKSELRDLADFIYKYLENE